MIGCETTLVKGLNFTYERGAQIPTVSLTGHKNDEVTFI